MDIKKRDFLKLMSVHSIFYVFLNSSMIASGQIKQIIYLILITKMLWYSVMQSDGNSFYGDVVLDSFNMAYWYENIILEQNHEN